jgi:ketosteroid isomerase-like protein
MKIRLVVALAGLAITFTAPVFAQQKDTVDPQITEQVRALAKYDEAFNRNDANAVTTLYTEDAVFETPNGTFSGREDIEGLYRKIYFERNHSKDHLTTVGEITEAGDETRATGTWSDTFEEIGTIHANGTYSWVLIHDGDSWKIRKSTFDISNERH